MTRRETAPNAATQKDGRALWIEETGRCALRQEKLPAECEGEVVVRTLYSGISRGTESLVFAGQVPESEYERMRAPHQAGRFPFPVKYGYAAVGIVEEGPERLVGRTVFCLHPHQDRFRVSVSAIHPLADGLPPHRAVLAANMETALNITWDAGIQPGDRVAVFGAGVVGLLVAYLASRIIGTEVVISDIEPERAETAKALGLRFSSADDVPHDCDVLVNASASADALATALDHAGFEARVIEASWYGEKHVEIPLGHAFHAKRLSIVSSQVASLPPGRRARWDTRRRMSKALQLLGDDRLDHLISGETPFETIAADYADIIGSATTLCHRIKY
ncbi:Oxidoreductase (Homolog to zinc-containing alcohol dehydrogenase / threonine 3-dehydrogenase) [Neorhizobium galegae bv. officinalis bv. officinalis str. HAMBI 1141]|uniref:Oxidoreductase (Homolog to zinc-containing alcohol dehydrogenase / threonine 3-dehydrogenase) n=1 Tax=Neorhizobium galegae bv. officinalis bv. officinalis str. HAMBI 1141 TaxID=1028801 RepID=A0A068TCJ4_NEOGA|nr:Oxidoreductase (Homolog to zinc-containing alcohol dehydrogenase / threonine 3-dehydrogenase) [Neorhizobium galegae bv. officinalis bv. officinalis str. HAMBI 1141]